MSRGHPGLHGIETASRDEIAALQLERLKGSLAHAYGNVPRYREKFDAAGVHPGDLRELADLARFPVTTKEDLRQTYPFGMFAVSMERVARIHASSGTTGKPTVVGYTQEVMGPGVANECIESKDGPVIWEDHFYPEVIDPHTGDSLADGEFGEPVFTTLTKEALPVIRYRTRDLTRLLPPTSRSIRRFEKITGRSDDMPIVRGVNVFPSQFEELLLGDTRLSPHYLLELRKEGALDVLKLKTETREPLPDSECAAIAGKLRERIKQGMGVAAEVAMEPPGGVPRSEGKAVRVIDRRPKT